MMNNAEKPQLTIPRVTSSVFCSDNLELMKTIESNTIDLIYCDINPRAVEITLQRLNDARS